MEAPATCAFPGVLDLVAGGRGGRPVGQEAETQWGGSLRVKGSTSPHPWPAPLTCECWREPSPKAPLPLPPAWVISCGASSLSPPTALSGEGVSLL